MLTDDPTSFRAPSHSIVRPRAPRRDDAWSSDPPRVIVGPPIGDGRVLYVQRLGAPCAPAPAAAPEVLLSLHGQRPGGDDEELLLQTAVRRCDLWNGDFDDHLQALVLWTGWAVTRIERRELVAAGSS
jgi:hypothetical protein